MTQDEEWAPIEELPHYLISNQGRVKRADEEAKARKISISDRGFPIITLYGRDGKTRYLRQINNLVADAFLRQPIDELQENSIWHIDGDLTNCKVDNLRWDTRPRVLEWNDMNRMGPKDANGPRVKNNRTGVIYENAYACAIAEGMLESEVLFRIERQAASLEDDNARYRYVFGDD